MFKMCCNKIRKKIYTTQSPKPLRKTKQIFISSSSFIRHFWLWFFYYIQKGKELLSTDNPVWGPNIFLYFFTKCGYHKNCLHSAIPMWAQIFLFCKEKCSKQCKTPQFWLSMSFNEKNEREEWKKGDKRNEIWRWKYIQTYISQVYWTSETANRLQLSYLCLQINLLKSDEIQRQSLRFSWTYCWNVHGFCWDLQEVLLKSSHEYLLRFWR